MLKNLPHAAACLATALTAAVVAPASAQVNLFANGGFEDLNEDGSLFGFQAAAAGFTLTSDARTGNSAIQLSSPQLNAAVFLQNSVEDGLLPGLTPGDTPELSFFAKGFAGTTGNVLFALSYLAEDGAILASSGNQFFQGLINPSTFTEITFALGEVPVGATSAFIEFSQGIGPINDVDLLGGTVVIDDLALTSSIAVPEPASLALLGAGGLALLARRRRAD